MTIEEILYQVAVENGHSSFNDVKYKYYRESINDNDFDNIIKEAMQRYAELKCKEQQIIDAKYVKSGVVCRKNEPPKIEVDKNSILNAPLATSKTT